MVGINRGSNKRRKSQKMSWDDKLFINRLEKIKARRMLNGVDNKIISNAELQSKMIKSPLFTKLENELLFGDNKMQDEFKLKKDRRKFFLNE